MNILVACKKTKLCCSCIFNYDYDYCRLCSRTIDVDTGLKTRPNWCPLDKPGLPTQKYGIEADVEVEVE